MMSMTFGGRLPASARMMAIAVLPFASLGCGPGAESDSAEPLSTELGAFGEPQCLTATPNFTNVVGSISDNFSDVSPQTYSNAHCGKALVYSLQDPGVPAFGTFAGASIGSISVYYGEHGPTNQADCQASETDLIVYTDNGHAGPWVQLGSQIQTMGYWSNNRCFHAPSVRTIPDHDVGFAGPPWHYKVFATARHPDHTTAKMIVQSGPCGHIGQLACANTICDEGTAQGGTPGGNTLCQSIQNRTIICPPNSVGTVNAGETLIVSNTGSWTFTGHVHDSGLFGLNYTLGIAAPNAYSGFQLGVVHSGVVHGTLDAGSRDSDFGDVGADARLYRNWVAIRTDADAGRWACKLHTSTNPWLVAEDALVGLGIAVVGAAAIMMGTDPSLECTDPQLSRDPNGDGIDMTTTCTGSRF